MSLAKAAGVFLVMAVADYLWAAYSWAISRRRAHLAARYAVALVLASGLTTLAIIESPLFLVPASLGAYVGTYVAVKM